MSIDFSLNNRWNAIKTVLFVKIDIPGSVLLLSDEDRPRTVGTDTYNELGSLLTVTASHSDIRASRYEMTITVTGLPVTTATAAFNDDAKGSPVTVLRGFVDVDTRQLIDAPIQKFSGIVNNVTFQETWAPPDSEFTIGFNCVSRMTLLQGRVAGRRTNDKDQKKYYPSDTSFKRVAAVKNANFNFGSPNPAARYGTTL